MIDLTLIFVWLIAFAILYLVGPVSIYFIGILTLICCLCSSTLSSLSTTTATIIRPTVDKNGVIVFKQIGSGPTSTLSSNSGIPDGYSRDQDIGYGSDGFDMTADEVYNAFKAHPYADKNLGYGYYDGYDYVL